MNAISTWILSGALALLLPANGTAAERAPERLVHGTTITSRHDPAVTIRLPKAARYAGAARWDLYDVCDAEIHVFVEADAQKQVQRLYWVQFEGYLPNNIYRYDYPFTEKTTQGGREFDVSASYDPSNKPVRPGSDFERVRALVAAAGYHLAPENMSVRLVNMLDDSKRKELMFIYSEDLALSGTTIEGLNLPEGTAKWEALKAGLLERAKERIRLTD
jgi:hypothetical protein